MRKFADLHLRPSLGNFKQVQNMIENSEALGYSLISIPIQPKTDQDTIRHLQSLCKNAGLDFSTRVDLTPNSPKELLGHLRRLRRKFELVCVVCNSKAVARQAAKDRRVDLLSFPSTNPWKRFFDSAEAELASQASASLEIGMSMILSVEGFSRIRLLSCFRREVATAIKFHVPVVISSGATDECFMRKPMEQAALAYLFGMQQPAALDALSTNPLNLVKRNREKLGPNFVAPGVRIIKRGKDC